MAFRRALLLCTVLLASAALAAACADERADSRSGSPTRTLSKREYIDRLNELQRDAAPTFASIASATRDPKTIGTHLAAIDQLATDVDALRPPRDWQDEQVRMVAALRAMRRAMQVLARASSSNRPVIERQIARYRTAQAAFQDAVRSINATR